jgi:type II restriction/modification system DNA methylase subunit YeeA
MWIIDFAEEVSRVEAALHEAPFEYVRQHIEPIRATNRDRQRRENWWRLGRSGGDLRVAVNGLARFIVTPRVSKYRLFVWIAPDTIPDSAVVAIARDDDYTFGVLHSRPHELWALALGTQLETRPRYTPTTCFETFPFPRPTDEQREAIAAAARELVRLRDGWLNPPGIAESELAVRTLTNLYNQRPTWLTNAHDDLDRAVLAAYGWPPDAGGDAILEQLLELNLRRQVA